MAFSNSFPSIHMNSSESTAAAAVEEEIVVDVEEEMSFECHSQTEYKWASVPTLTNTAITSNSTTTREEEEEEELQLCSFDGRENLEDDYNSDQFLPEETDSNSGQRVQYNGGEEVHQIVIGGGGSDSDELISVVNQKGSRGERGGVEGGTSQSNKKRRENQQQFLQQFSPPPLGMEQEKDFKNEVGGGKNCDLIAEIGGGGGGVENQNEIGRELAMDQMAASMMSSFDDNGNPLSLEEQGLINVNEMNGFLEVKGGGGGGAAEGFVKIEQQQQQHEQKQLPKQQQHEQLVTSTGSLTKSTGSGSESNKQSMHEKIENPIRFGFKSTLQKSVEGMIDEPKYFINAAALSEDLETYTLPSIKSDLGDDDDDYTVDNDDTVDGAEHGNLSNKKQMMTNQDTTTFMKSSLEGKNSTITTTTTSTTTTTVKKNTKNVAPSRLPTIMVKPRVPMSKSFPDIIQTTFVDERLHREEFTSSKKLIHADTMKEKESSFNDLAADSLEELNTAVVDESDFENTFKTQSKLQQQQQRQQQQQNYHFQQSEKFQADFKATTAATAGDNHKLEDLMSMSQMAQSQIGILSEKPPEAWVIDFNSLSMDSENFDTTSDMSSSMKSSNPNSLAFFIDMDDNSTASESTGAKKGGGGGDGKSPDKKKIFSMFVDFGSQQQQQQDSSQKIVQPSHHHNPLPHHAGIKPSRLPVHRNVMNVLKDGETCLQFSGGGGSSQSSGQGGKGVASKKCNFQYPSPILQHKAAAEAARKTVAKIEMLESASAAPTTTNIMIASATDQMGNQSKELTRKDEENVGGGSNNNSAVTSCTSNNMDASTTSNRSSLHVATNEFDMMNFSSSFISSMETSAPDQEEICSKGPCFKLGKDLLRMFEDGINTDVKICVNGRFLRAHKCILSSRSQYFAAIFSGPWIEKAGNTIPLNGFSYNVVHFTMCHIYSGTNEIPDTIDLLELATLTDLLGLEGLRENISQTIRVKFCHNFHRPCTGCISGVLECFPIALSYDMDELHRKMTKWICKHFVRIWPTKAFANLGDELIEKCLRYSVNHLSVDNILDITLGCDQLLTTMPSVRWTEPIFSVVNQMSEACVQFIGENFSQVVQCQRFLLFGKGQQWNISRIEGTFADAMLLMKPDEACLSHAALSSLIDLGHTIDEVELSTMFVDFLKMLAKEIERYLTANASKAVLSKYWEQLGQDVRKRICTTSFLGYDKAGNKIVKGNTGGGGTSHAKSSGRLTPSERSSSISSIKSNASSSKTSRHAKIASVRPMQNVLPTTTTATGSTETRGATQTGTGSKGNHSKSSRTHQTHSGSSSSSSSNTRQQKVVEVSKEKSFTNSPRNSVASTTASAARTPMTPSKPGIGLIGSSTTTTTKTRATTAKHHQNTSVNVTATQPPPPPKSTFVTNSARANAVSKPPNLRPKTVSSSTRNNMSSTTTTTTTTPRTPNLSQPSRYASALGAVGRHSRASLTGEEKMEKVLSPVTTNNVELSKVRSGRMTSTTGASGGVSTSSSSSVVAAASTSGGRKLGKNHNNKNSNGSSLNTSNSSSRKTSAKTSAGGRNSNNSGTALEYVDPLRDSVMSKSTIETDSGEIKMRTLAEIGRSSTFSKDEPTILGKLDQTTLNIDFS